LPHTIPKLLPLKTTQITKDDHAPNQLNVGLDHPEALDDGQIKPQPRISLLNPATEKKKLLMTFHQAHELPLKCCIAKLHSLMLNNSRVTQPLTLHICNP
jgi:hypothetical protein